MEKHILQRKRTKKLAKLYVLYVCLPIGIDRIVCGGQNQKKSIVKTIILRAINLIKFSGTQV